MRVHFHWNHLHRSSTFVVVSHSLARSRTHSLHYEIYAAENYPNPCVSRQVCVQKIILKGFALNYYEVSSVEDDAFRLPAVADIFILAGMAGTPWAPPKPGKSIPIFPILPLPPLPALPLSPLVLTLVALPPLPLPLPGVLPPADHEERMK